MARVCRQRPPAASVNCVCTVTITQFMRLKIPIIVIFLHVRTAYQTFAMKRSEAHAVGLDCDCSVKLLFLEI